MLFVMLLDPLSVCCCHSSVPGAVAAGAGVATAIASNVAITAGKGLVDGGMAAVSQIWLYY